VSDTLTFLSFEAHDHALTEDRFQCPGDLASDALTRVAVSNEFLVFSPPNGTSYVYKVDTENGGTAPISRGTYLVLASLLLVGPILIAVLRKTLLRKRSASR
jgi:hypothetical protein